LLLLLLFDNPATLPLALAPCPLALAFPLTATGASFGATVGVVAGPFAGEGPFAAAGDGENMIRVRWIHARLSRSSGSRGWDRPRSGAFCTTASAHRGAMRSVSCRIHRQGPARSLPLSVPLSAPVRGQGRARQAPEASGGTPAVTTDRPGGEGRGQFAHTSSPSLVPVRRWGASWLPVSVSPDSLQRGSTSKERLCAHGAPPAKETEGAQWQQCIVPFHTSRFVQFISHSSPFLAALCVFFPLAAPVLLFAALCFFRRSSSQRRRFLQPRH
jgi:hypothetical protein